MTKLLRANGEVIAPKPKLVAFCGVEFEDGPPMLVIKGFSSEVAVAEFCLKLAALGIVMVQPIEPDPGLAGSLQ